MQYLTPLSSRAVSHLQNQVLLDGQLEREGGEELVEPGVVDDEGPHHGLAGHDACTGARVSVYDNAALCASTLSHRMRCQRDMLHRWQPVGPKRPLSPCSCWDGVQRGHAASRKLTDGGPVGVAKGAGDKEADAQQDEDAVAQRAVALRGQPEGGPLKRQETAEEHHAPDRVDDGPRVPGRNVSAGTVVMWALLCFPGNMQANGLLPQAEWGRGRPGLPGATFRGLPAGPDTSRRKGVLWRQARCLHGQQRCLKRHKHHYVYCVGGAVPCVFLGSLPFVILLLQLLRSKSEP